MNLRDLHPIIRILIIVFLSCIGLFWLDHETHSWGDFLKGGNPAAFVVYFLPTSLITLALFFIFKKLNFKYGLISSVLIGIPVSFALIVIGLFIMMGRMS